MEAVRFVLLGALLVQYSALAGVSDDGTPPTTCSGGLWPEKSHTRFVRACELLAEPVLAAFLLHKLAVLLVSLPPQRPPPASLILRRFFTDDPWCLARHVAELVASVVLLGARTALGELPLRRFVPVGLAAAAPIMHLVCWYPTSVCLKEIALFTAYVALTPLLASLEIGRLVLRHRRRLANPLDGPMHTGLACAAIIASLACSSRRPVATLFSVHSLFLGLGLLEHVTMGKLPWRDGRAWWCALLVAVEATSIAVDRRWFTLLLLLIALRSLQKAAARPQLIFEGNLWWCTLLVVSEAASLVMRELRGVPECMESAELPACIWLGLLCGLACVVNWRRCMRQYRTWQRRHATFVLSTGRRNHSGATMVPTTQASPVAATT